MELLRDPNGLRRSRVLALGVLLLKPLLKQLKQSENVSKKRRRLKLLQKPLKKSELLPRKL